MERLRIGASAVRASMPAPMVMTAPTMNTRSQLPCVASSDASGALISQSRNLYTFKGRLFITNERESASGAGARPWLTPWPALPCHRIARSPVRIPVET